MTERPILFSAPMVRAILAGTKTQTRRAIRRPERFENIRECGFCSPFGVPGDRLWVREAWRVSYVHDRKAPRDLLPRAMTVGFEAGGSVANQGDGWRRDDTWPPAGETPEWFGRLRPGMFLPRWASRITLEVVEVRVERLQDISEADAEAEGCERPLGIPLGPHFMRSVFRGVWESINGAGSWDANPWVWCVTFRPLATDAARLAAPPGEPSP